MLGLLTIQGTTAPAQGPAIPPVPPRAGAGTGAQADAQAAAAAGQAAAQAATDAVNQELARLQEIGQPVVLQPPPYRTVRNNDIPDEVIPLAGMAFSMVVTIVLGLPIIRFIIRMVERKADNSSIRASDVTAQLRALQESVDTMAIEIERVSEGQRFTAKLMAERERLGLKSPSETA
jgi:hypothetical protein